MASSDIYVNFGASTGDLEQASARAKESLADFGSQARASSDAARDSFAGLHDSFASIEGDLKRLAALAGVAFTEKSVQDWAKSVTAAADQLSSQSAKFGQSLAEAQTVGGVAKLSGADADTLRSGLDALNSALAKTAEDGDTTRAALTALGISEDQLKGKLPTTQLEVIAQALSRFADGSTKTAAATALLGSAGADMIRSLDGGAARLRELEQATRDAGAVLAGPTVEAMSATHAHILELGLAWSSLSQRIYGVVNPAIDATVVELKRLVEGLDAETIRAGVIGIGDAAIGVAETIGEFAIEATAHLQGLFDLMGKIGNAAGAIEKALTPPAGRNAGLQNALGLLSDEDYGRVQLQQKMGGAPAAVDSTTAAIEHLRAVMAGAKKEFDDLMGKPTTAHSDAAMGAAYQPPGAAKPQVPAMDTSKDDKDKTDRDALEAAMETYQKEVDAFKATADQKEAILNEQLRTHAVTMGQWLTQTETVLSQEAISVKATYDKEAQIAGLTQKQIAEIRTREFEQLTEIAKQETAAQVKAAEASSEAWDKWANDVNTAMTGQIKGLLEGTENWATAFKRALEDMTVKLIEFGVNWGAQVVENSAKQIVLGNQVVAARTAGDATMAAADTSAAGAGLGAMLANANAAIAVDLKQVAAGVAAFLAPFFGPAAVPAGLAAAGGIGMADIGAWDVPHDQLMLIHKNEMVATPSQAAGIRSLVEGGSAAGGGGGRPVSVNPSTHFHINANDSASVAQWARNNGPELAKAMNEAARHGALLGMRALRR